MKKFKRIEHNSPEYSQSVALRDAILRKPLGLVFSKEDLEAEKDSIHLAGYDSGEKLICCLVLKPLDDKLVRMRQVAVSEDVQGKGWGKELVLESERVAREKGFTRMMCHARDHAISFYMKLNYFKVGDEFEEVGIRHFRMEKNI